MKQIRTYLCVLTTVAATAVLLAPGSASAASSHTSPNLIRNPGAEQTGQVPTDDGSKVPITDWTVGKKQHFTAVPYGADGFPLKSDPGPKSRGNNFFAGGPNGRINIATQRDSLSGYTGWIKSGKATFALSGWLGGYEDQGDNVVLSISWTNSKGARVGGASIGPVTSGARNNATKLLYRSTHGTVPASATSVLVKVTARRTDGVYDDGYADNFGLVVRS